MKISGISHGVRRAALAIAGVVGLLAITASPAAAMISVNHTEPSTSAR